MDLISVIIPVFHVQKYLDQCVQSVADQSYRNLEIILVDDGSHDECSDMCDLWKQRDERVHVIHKENGGLSDARNAGLKVAHGEYITFIDSDDWITGGFIQCLYELICRFDADVAECGVIITDEDGTELRKRDFGRKDQALSQREALRYLVLEDGIYQTVWNKLYRKSIVDGLLFEKGRFHEDDFWTYQVFMKCKSLAVTSTPLYYYRQRGSGIMGKGYTIRRLDGLEARIRRRDALQKDEELRNIVNTQIWYDFLYHYQSAVRCLKGTDKKHALAFIVDEMRKTPDVSFKGSFVNKKYQIWLSAFKRHPFITAGIRNVLKIGV